MCDTCRPILGKWARAHPRTPCPVEKALYCTTCCVYGHSPCATSYISSAQLEDTLYPIDNQPTILKDAWIVEDDEECIKSALILNGGTPMICQEKGKQEMKEYRENKKRIVELAKLAGHVLVLREGSATGKEKRG